MSDVDKRKKELEVVGALRDAKVTTETPTQPNLFPFREIPDSERWNLLKYANLLAVETDLFSEPMFSITSHSCWSFRASFNLVNFDIHGDSDGLISQSDLADKMVSEKQLQTFKESSSQLKV